MAQEDYSAVGGLVVLEDPDRTVLQLWGEVDESLADQAASALSRTLGRDLPVVVDCARVTFLGSAGVAFLAQLCAAGHEEGLTVTLHEASPAVGDVLELLGLRDMFDGDVPAMDSATGDAGDTKS